MMLGLEPHGHVHAGFAGHVHTADIPEDEHPFWLGMSEAYAGLRGSLQLLAGLQLLGVRTSDRADLRRAVLLRVKIQLDEARERLHALSPSGKAVRLLDDLVGCCELLAEIARRQATQPGSGTAAEQTHQMLKLATERLLRCQRYDLGLRFFGSGGCADVEHALSHLRPGGSTHD